MTRLMNYEAVYRTAPATPGLLKKLFRNTCAVDAICIISFYTQIILRNLEDIEKVNKKNCVTGSMFYASPQSVRPTVTNFVF